MDFPTAIKSIMTGRRFMAVLGEGPRLVMSERSKVMDVRNGRPRVYAGKATDYLSIEWQVVDLAELAKKREAAA